MKNNNSFKPTPFRGSAQFRRYASATQQSSSPMDDRITASFDELLRQASMTADTYMSSAVREIDQTFGAGFAKANPALVAAFMQVASADFAAASNGKILGSALDRIANALGDVAEALREQC